MNPQMKTRSARWPEGTIQVAICCQLLQAGSVLAFADIVFDPANLIENVRQVTALLMQIDRANTQIELQEQLLAHLPVSVAEALADAAEAVHQSLSPSFPDFETIPIDAATRTEAVYPITVSGTTAWLDTMRPLWTQTQRDSLIYERGVYMHAEHEMLPAAERLESVVAVSNGAHAASEDQPGVVAVAQAHHELLAVCAGEVDKFIALRAVRAKRRIEAQARAQSEAAYQSARRAALTSDWESENHGSARPVDFPF